MVSGVRDRSSTFGIVSGVSVNNRNSTFSVVSGISVRDRSIHLVL